MKFEIIKNGNPVFVTEHMDCIHPIQILRSMNKAGYTFRIDGRKVSLTEVIKIVEQGK